MALQDGLKSNNRRIEPALSLDGNSMLTFPPQANTMTSCLVVFERGVNRGLECLKTGTELPPSVKPFLSGLIVSKHTAQGLLYFSLFCFCVVVAHV